MSNFHDTPDTTYTEGEEYTQILRERAAKRAQAATDEKTQEPSWQECADKGYC